MEDIELIGRIIFRHKNTLLERHKDSVFKTAQDDSMLLAGFSKHDNTVLLTDKDSISYFMASSFKGVMKRGKKSAGTIARETSISLLVQRLKNSELYEPIPLTDEDCGIEDAILRRGTQLFTSTDRSRFRSLFRDRLARGLPGVAAGVYAKKCHSSHPVFLSIFRIPRHDRDNPCDHVARCSLAVTKCTEVAPTFMDQEAKRRFKLVMRNMCNMGTVHTTALRRYLFDDSSSPSHNKEQEELFLNLILKAADGQDVSDDLISDLRQFNSRGGSGDSSTKFESFWEKCGQILHNENQSGAHERRTDQVLYASKVVSIPDLITQAKSRLQDEVDNVGHSRTELPPIPNLEWVRLQFSPNSDVAASAAKLTGRLNIVRKVQTRTLRKEHQDQHWNSAFTRYHLEWVVEVKNCLRDKAMIQFLGQDDKAKIPVGADVAVSTGVRYNKSAIVSKEDITMAVNACDHDFGFANIVPSVTLTCNIPDSMAGSFFGGGETGDGEIDVTLKDAVFQKSDVFYHTAQLVQSLESRDRHPYVLLLQTDGGPDHNIKFVRTKLAMIALFFKMDLDHLVVIRGAPNGSYLNKVERGMSTLNLGLQHVALVRKTMPDWAENGISSAGSMKEVRKFAEDHENKKKGDMERAAMRKKALSSGGAKPAIAAMMNVDGSDLIMHDDSLPFLVDAAQSKRESELQQQDFRNEWALSMGAVIQAVSERFGHLKLDGRPVRVMPVVEASEEEELHNILKTIDREYHREIRLQTQWSDVRQLEALLSSHVVQTPYSMSIRKCGKDDCAMCKPIRCPLENGGRQLAMQRQVTPRIDTARPGHFLSRDVALLSSTEQSLHAQTDLTDLPSNRPSRDKEEEKRKKQRDQKVTTDLKLKSWEASKVRGFVICEECRKPRCIYSQTDETFQPAAQAVQREIEQAHFMCGDILLGDDKAFGKVVVQQLNLDCRSPIEKAYYNTPTRRLQTTDVCVHCGSPDGLKTQEELQKLGLTKGFACRPLCSFCLTEGKKPTTTGRARQVALKLEKAATKKRKAETVRGAKASVKVGNNPTKKGKAETVLSSWVGSKASTKTRPSEAAAGRPFVTSPYPSTSTLVIRSQLETVFQHLINVPPDGNCGYHILQEFRSRNGNHEMVPTADFRKSIRDYFDDNQESLLGENKYFRRGPSGGPLATITNGKTRDQLVSDNLDKIFEEGIDFQPGCGNRHWLAAEWTFPIAVLKFGMNVVVYQDDYGNGAGNTDRYTWKEGGDVHFELDFGRVTLDDPLVENTMYAAHVNGNHYILLDK